MGATTLQPGQSTTVSLTMAMHRGMEGPHLFRITVPVIAGSAPAATLELLLAADFGG